MAKFDEQYLDLCERILKDGTYAENRTGIATYRLPHQVLQFDLSEEFPILTTKFVAFKHAVLEMLWIYQAQSNDVRWLQERGIKIWNEWQIDEKGFYQGKDFGKEHAFTIGTAYGWIVRRYELVQNLIETIKTDPNNRRMIMSLWQNEFLPTAALPSCVWNSQWGVIDGKLNVMVTVRSNDVPLGAPFNVSQYAVLCYLIAQVCGLKAGLMTYVINDAHIYENQIDGIKEQIARRAEKLEKDGELLPAPKLWINPKIKDFFQFDNSKKLLDIKLENYEHQGKIAMPVAV
ncbi:MAG: thymidylate synthase [Candidatus Nomurabacteria bacterium]|jgi:thymidylate synthase|nr:thymidylate synthase [Candidatus Nomurabacteria bacterium]